AAGLIAVVDDDEAVRDGLEALLESWGYETVAFPDAETFLENGLARDVTCLLLDVRLPGMDGLELVAELRRRGHYVPILMMSAHGDVSTAVEAMRRGAQDFIEKPFNVDQLLVVVSRALEASRLRRENATLREAEVEGLRLIGKSHARTTMKGKLDRVARGGSRALE
ncbi:MAG: response regulator, partial [Pseudomonadota bacterium]